MKIKLEKLLFMMGYSIFLFIIMFNNIEPLQWSFKYLNLMGFLLLVLIFFVQNRTISIKTLFKYVLLTTISVLVFISGINSNRVDYYLIELVLLMFVSKNIRFYDIIKFDFLFKFLNILIIVFMAKMGIIENLVFIRNGVIREALGFTHPNVFSAILVTCNIDLLYLATKNGKVLTFSYIFTLISLLVLIFVTNSRSSFGLLLPIFIVFIFRNRKTINATKYTKCLVLILFPLLCILSLYLTHLFSIGNETGIFFNELFSGRLLYNNLFLQSHSINMFGNNLYFTGMEAAQNYGRYNMILDNSYIYILLRFGIISILLLFIMFFITFKKLFNKQKYFIIWIMVFFLIYGMFERHSFVVFYNSFLMLFKFLIYNNEEEQNEI